MRPLRPLVQSLTAFVESVRPQAMSDMSFYFRIRDSVLRLYSGVVLHRRFRPVLIGFFLIVVVVQLALVALIALAGVVLGSAELAAQLQLGFLSVAQLTSLESGNCAAHGSPPTNGFCGACSSAYS